MTSSLPLRTQLTALLRSADPESPPPLDELVPLLYEDLRRLARRQLAREPAGHTLQTTALVHEAYLKLVEDAEVTGRGRAYFFGAAARAMRQVLVDHARRRKAAKRGGGALQVPLAVVRLDVDGFAAELLDLDRALEALEDRNPRHARVVECRFFGGLTVEETADALGVSARTVKYDWALARAWLFERLRGPPPDASPVRV